MRIRQEQMNVFQQDAEGRYEDRVIGHLKKNFSDARTEPDAKLRPAVREELAKAISYGLRSETQGATFVTSAWVLGRGFDTSFPAARRVLPSENVSPEDKETWLREWTVEITRRLAG